VAVHAIRNLSRIAFGRAVIRWSQLGFGRTSSTSTSQATPRNLFGFKDGTANVKAEETGSVAEHVWVADTDDPAWMAGGSYLVARKIRMIIESWDRTRLEEQERVIGRDKADGAPLSGGTEFTEPRFDRPDDDGTPRIAEDAHVRLAHPDANGGARMLRRGYNFVDGNDELGRLDAGLFFLSFQRDPQQFVAVQRSLAGVDALNEYIKHVGSAVFAIPPGAREGGSIGDPLFS
jgi:deferrochelatase/peroxidase EfeB